MSELICITNRQLCTDNFLNRIEMLASCHPKQIILREKDLSPDEYKELAIKVLAICQPYHTPCVLHNFPAVAMELNCSAVHLPLPVLRGLSSEERAAFTTLGTSCSSIADALEAEALGCTYLIAGHIFDTDCKKGLPGRGVEFLHEVCSQTALPVYGIGGISAENIAEVHHAGAAGACIMSGVMTCEHPQAYISTLQSHWTLGITGSAI